MLLFFYRKRKVTKRNGPVTSPSGSPARRGCGRTRRNSPCMSQGSDSRRVLFDRSPDAQPRDKGTETHSSIEHASEALLSDKNSEDIVSLTTKVTLRHPGESRDLSARLTCLKLIPVFAGMTIVSFLVEIYQPYCISFAAKWCPDQFQPRDSVFCPRL